MIKLQGRHNPVGKATRVELRKNDAKTTYNNIESASDYIQRAYLSQNSDSHSGAFLTAKPLGNT